MAYPASVVAFTTKNQAETIQNTHVNDLQTEVTALESGLLNGITHVLPLLSGKVSFPAAQSASSDANTLDDYEEGAWTPISTVVAITFTYALPSYYVKIGRAVFFSMVATWPATADATAAVIDGLPFTAVASNFGLAVGLSQTGSAVVARVERDSTQIILTDLSGATLANSVFSSKQLQLSGWYEATA